MNEKQAFASRLRAAMEAAGHEARTAVLEKHFNLRWHGQPISFQAVRRWLLGETLPSQDKLVVLADWLGVSPEALRYGTTTNRTAREASPPWPKSISDRDSATIQAFLSLPAKQRELVAEMITALAARPLRKR